MSKRVSHAIGGPALSGFGRLIPNLHTAPRETRFKGSLGGPGRRGEGTAGAIDGAPCREVFLLVALIRVDENSDSNGVEEGGRKASDDVLYLMIVEWIRMETRVIWQLRCCVGEDALNDPPGQRS